MLEIGNKYVVKIEGYNHKGEGITHIDDFVLFVENAIVGEIIEVVIKKLNKNYGIGEISDILSFSDSRVIPICDIYNSCGGCNLQHMDYKEQVNFKKNKILEAFNKIGKIDNIKIYKFHSMSIPYEYRNKVQVPFGYIDNTVVAGFYKNKTHQIVNMNHCYIQFKESNNIISKTREYLKENEIPIYDEINYYKKGEDFGLFRNLLVRKGYNTNDLMVVIVLTRDEKDFLDGYVEYLLSLCKNIKTIILNINDRVTNVPLGDKERILYGNGYITDKINDFVFKIHSRSFFQVNTKQAEKLYSLAIDMAELKYGDVLLDAYCGIGSIGICASRKVKKVYGIDEFLGSIEDANENKIINNIKNIEFIHGKVEDAIFDLINEGNTITVIILDPPRKGVKESVLHKLRKINCKKIVYISCDVSTLARDSAILVSLGYKISRVCAVDMFCQTYHVETVVKFTL